MIFICLFSDEYLKINTIIYFYNSRIKFFKQPYIIDDVTELYYVNWLSNQMARYWTYFSVLKHDLIQPQVFVFIPSTPGNMSKRVQPHQ